MGTCVNSAEWCYFYLFWLTYFQTGQRSIPVWACYGISLVIKCLFTLYTHTAVMPRISGQLLKSRKLSARQRRRRYSFRRSTVNETSDDNEVYSSRDKSKSHANVTFSDITWNSTLQKGRDSKIYSMYVILFGAHKTSFILLKDPKHFPGLSLNLEVLHHAVVFTRSLWMMFMVSLALIIITSFLAHPHGSPHHTSARDHGSYAVLSTSWLLISDSGTSIVK